MRLSDPADQGAEPGPRTVVAFVAFLVWVFATAFLIGRLSGPDAPDAGRRNPPGVPAPPTGSGNEKRGHDHGLAPFAAPLAPG